MTPSCDTCQLDFRPGEEADMETWERDGVARCGPCAREFAQIRRFVDITDAYRAIDDFWRALDDALASPLAAEIDARCSRYPPPGGRASLMLTSTPPTREQSAFSGFVPGPVTFAGIDFPRGFHVRHRSRPNG
jgi:hypothetical protein